MIPNILVGVGGFLFFMSVLCLALLGADSDPGKEDPDLLRVFYGGCSTGIALLALGAYLM